MNINRRGTVVAGNAGVGVWLQGVHIRAGAGFPNWLDDDTILYNGAGGLRTCDADGGDDRQMDSEGGAPVYARGGAWASYLSGRGLRTSWGLQAPSLAPLGVGPDGTVYATTYQQPEEIRAYPIGAYASALVVPAARPMVSLGTTPGHLTALDGLRFVWADQSLRLQSYGLPAPAQVPEAAYQPTILEPLPGRYWLVYRTQSGRGVLHPLEDASRGYVAGTGCNGFTAWCPSPGVIECCWATGEGNNGEVGPITRRQFIASDDLVEIPPPDVPPIAKIGRPLWLGFYTFGAPTIDTPGNCDMRVGGRMRVRTLDGRDVAVYAMAEPDSDLDLLEADIVKAKAEADGLDVIPYWTKPAQQVRVPRGSRSIGIEAYRRVDETEAQFEARLRGAVRRVERAWLIGQFYLSNGGNTTDLESVMRVLARVARDERNVVGILLFHGGPNRNDGWEKIPQARDAVRQLFAGITGTPEIYREGRTPPIDPKRPTDPPPAAGPIPRAIPFEVKRMDPVIGYIVGPNGKYGRVDPQNEQKLVLFDGTEPSDAYEVELSKPDNRFQARFLRGAGDKHGDIVSFIPLSDPRLDPSRAFELRKARGGWESPEAYKLADSTIELVGRNDVDNRQYLSVPLVFVPKAA